MNKKQKYFFTAAQVVLLGLIDFLFILQADTILSSSIPVSLIIIILFANGVIVWNMIGFLGQETPK